MLKTGKVATACEMHLAVGVRGVLAVDGWSVPVVVRDLRTVWGRVQALASDGRREAWVESTRITLACSEGLVAS